MARSSGTLRPGQTANPNGRPKKGWTLSETMRNYLSEKDPKTKKIRRDELVEATREHALAGDPTSLKLIWNYMDGMPKQQVDVTSDGEKINFTVYSPEKRPEPEE